MDNQEKVNILNDNSIITREKYYRIFGEWVSRDKAKYALNKMRKELGLALPHKNVVDKVIINSDGSQQSEIITDCDAEKLKDSKFLLDLHHYNNNEFELVNAQSSIWQGGKNGKELHSSKIKVKPINSKSNIVELSDKMVEKYLKVKDVAERKEIINDHVLEICLPDLHFGCTENEVGDFTSLHDRHKIIILTEQLINYISSRDIREIKLVFLGDILHYDTLGKTTSHGTQQCSNIPFQEMYDNAVDSLSYLIRSINENLKQTYKDSYELEIIYVPGNHDTLLGYTLMSVLKALFGNEVLFDIKQKERKYITIGNNLIGYTHGDMDKKKILQWVYTEAKSLISQSENIEIHAGHFHSEQTIEDNGVILRYLPTSAAVSPWEYGKGYSSKRKFELFLWDKNNGLEDIHYINL